MKKTRILIANDYSELPTGYGVYCKELLTRLAQTGKYEIAEIACYVDQSFVDRKENKSPWKIYGNVPEAADSEETKKEYGKNAANAFGAFKFHEACLDFKPDIVFDMRDYWMYSYQEISPFRPFFKWVVMPTVDSSPQKREWLHTFANMDLVIPYTEWAKKTLETQCKDTINLFPGVVNAGVDLHLFTPPEDRKAMQKGLFGRDVEITGCVMRNQKRKLIPDVMKAYRLYLDRLLEEGQTEKYEKNYLYIHTTYPEHAGWDIQSLLMEHSLLHKTYFTSKCGKCGSIGITKFHCNSSICGTCQEPTYRLITVNNAASSKDLAFIYQTFDLFLQIAICEGFGMPQIEAAACGVPIISTDYSAMSEIVRKLEGFPLKPSTLFREMETGADRANIDYRDLAESIYSYHSMTEEEKIAKAKRTRELCEKHYSWDATAKVWDEALSSVDISSNAKWDDPVRETDTKLSVPGRLTPTEVIEWIIINIIKEPYLLETAPIKSLMYDTIAGYVLQNGRMANMDISTAIKVLENYMRNKIISEANRTQKND